MMLDPASIIDEHGNPPTEGAIASFQIAVNTIIQQLEAYDVRGPFRPPMENLGDREIPPNVMKCLEESLFLHGAAKGEKIAAAYRKAEIFCHAYGRKKGKFAVMTNTTPNAATLAALDSALGISTPKTTSPVTATATTHIAEPVPMPTAVGIPVKAKRASAPKKAKTPLHQDEAAQIAKMKQYPWIAPGSFRADPEKPTGTLCDIICQECGSRRTIHLADAFQVKLCSACKGKNRKVKPSVKKAKEIAKAAVAAKAEG